MGEPKDPVVEGEGARGLTRVPFLVKVDRYGSVSGLVRVRVPLGILVITRSNEAGSFDRSLGSLAGGLNHWHAEEDSPRGAS